ncbi:hypothetical protein C8F01DRAFT_1360541 [Mycena amicta]|nr:hypothetical protein C8F01DRAFT_1360541 [Mycena amicta]
MPVNPVLGSARIDAQTSGSADDNRRDSEQEAYPVFTTVPNEIIAEIFQHYPHPYPACPPFHGDGSPTQLAQICGLWRNIAHATPGLWRAIKLDLHPNGVRLQLEAVLGLLEIAKTWLGRSRSLPVSIVFNCDANTPRRVQYDAAIALLEHCSRWQYADLVIPPHATSLDEVVTLDSEEALRLTLTRRSMPILVHLQIFSQMRASDYVLGPIDTPRLQTLSGRLGDDESFFSIFSDHTWGQLTTLKLADMPPDFAARILAQTGALVHCWIRIWDDSAHPVASEVRLAHLETFILDARQRRSMNELLDALVLPVLQRLAIKEDFLLALSPDLDHPDPVASLLGLIQRWGCSSSLKRLCIINCHSAPEFQVSAFPKIYYLELDDGPPGEWGPPGYGDWGVEWPQ